MAYVIFAFDGLEAPIYLQDGDQQNMGTGNALTNFTQLAGGGFFDNYGTTKSPQGIRPITKRAVIWGSNAANTRYILDNWRKKMGVRGKLTVRFDDGSLRWQWARLQDVSAPRAQSDKGIWVTVDMTWITADQSWRGIISSEDEWNWGDNTWVFGDGTAAFGEQDHTYTLTTTGLVIPTYNLGNIDATNLRVACIPDVDVTQFSVLNQTNSHSATVLGTTVTAGQEIVIDAGAMSVTIDGDDAYQYFVANEPAPWIPLVPGSNNVQINYISAGTLNTTVRLSWYDYYA